MVIAPENFRDEEYFETKAVLEKAGISISTASKSIGEKRGMLGGTAVAEMSIDKIDEKGFDGIVWVGGTGSQVYFNDKKAHELSKKFASKGKVVAAICIAPVILANAGLLNGKKATCWNGQFKERLKVAGAIWQGSDVVRDGKIVTANGPHAAKKFGEEVVKALKT
ncbi:MAG: DJ-1/PfpI family protein [Candidatus Aenigmatarchaeota archaeon]